MHALEAGGQSTTKTIFFMPIIEGTLLILHATRASAILTDGYKYNVSNSFAQRQLTRNCSRRQGPESINRCTTID